MIDDKFFPLPVTRAERYQRECSDIEESAKRLQEDIRTCYSLRHTYELQDRIWNWRMGWGKNIYAGTWHDSLMLQLRAKQELIMEVM